MMDVGGGDPWIMNFFIGVRAQADEHREQAQKN